MITKPTAATIKITKAVYQAGKRQLMSDVVVNEQPLQIRIIWQASPTSSHQRESKIFTITMRTPGEDKALAIGLLLSEGVIQSIEDIETIDDAKHGDEQENHVDIFLVAGKQPYFASIDKYQMTYSSCGLCGTTSMSALEQKNPPVLNEDKSWLNIDAIHRMPDLMKKSQNTHQHTGGQHAASLFNESGEIIMLMEDIGRHNALDKLIGHMLINHQTKTSKSNCHPIIVISSRVSFEMVQKAVMAGITVLVAVGAPSSLAITAAHRFNLTLIGFASKTTFNVYSGDWRLSSLKE